MEFERLILPLRSKKRNPQSTDTNNSSSTLKKLPSSLGLSDSASGKPRDALGKEVRTANLWGDGVPSLDVDIRNSLILPRCEDFLRSVIIGHPADLPIQPNSEVLRAPSISQSSIRDFIEDVACFPTCSASWTIHHQGRGRACPSRDSRPNLVIPNLRP